MRQRARIKAFVREIRAWFAIHKRSLPWRDLAVKNPTERAYRILVSEVMLQQTQVPRVIIMYTRFLDQFPTLKHLAEASNTEVIIAWRGMGYNGRALRLREAARAIMKNEKWKIENYVPTIEDFLIISGVGRYTAAAILNFAFNIPTPCIDTNIRRVLHRTFVGPENADGSWKKDDTYLLKLAGAVLEEAIFQEKRRGIACNAPADWHAALMDYGSMVQTKRNPKWDLCPLTAKKIMKCTQSNLKTTNYKLKTEPGRLVGSVFVPNRIFRGRVVELLRDSEKGLTSEQIGSHISVDWDRVTHKAWLQGLLKQLLSDRLIREERGKYVLG